MNNDFKELLLRALLIIGSIVSLINLPILYNINLFFMYIIAIFTPAYLIIFFLLKSKKISYDLASSAGLYILFLETLTIPIFTAAETHLIYWGIMYPMVIFNLKSNKYALIRSFIHLSIFILLFLFFFFFPSYLIMQIVVFSLLYLTMIVVVYFISQNVEMKEKMLYEQNIKLKNQQELYTLVFENSSNGVLIIDPNTQKFVDCNNKIVEVLKYNSKKDILHSHPCQLSPLY